MRFRFEQTVNSTVVIFERPGSQVTVAEDDCVSADGGRGVVTGTAWSIPMGDLSKNERRAMEIAAANGNVTTRALANDAQVTKRTASTALRRLAERGLLEWIGKGPSDPNQFYRIPR